MEIQQQGRRYYITGNTYPIKDKLRASGCHWDAERKAWWTAKKDVAEAVLGGAAAQTADGQPSHDETVDPRRTEIIGKAEYKNHEYLMLYEGETKRGRAAKLCFRDGSKVFWASAGEYRVTKVYREALTIAKLDKLAAEYKEQKSAEQKAAAEWERQQSMTAEERAALSAKRNADVLSQAATLASRIGVTVIGTTTVGFTREGKQGPELGEVNKSKGKYYMVVSVGTAGYASQDDLEDMDDFRSRPGWSVNYLAIEVSEPDTERQAREAREATAKAKADELAAELAAWHAALAQIPTDYRKRHGSAYGGTVTMTSASGTVSTTEPALDTSRLPWAQIAAHVTRVDDPHSGIHGRIQDAETLYSAPAADGRTIYRLHSSWGFGDDVRETYYLPEDLWQQMLLAEIQARGITPEMAEKWLAESRGCVGTELYEFAATLRSGAKMIGE